MHAAAYIIEHTRGLYGPLSWRIDMHIHAPLVDLRGLMRADEPLVHFRLIPAYRHVRAMRV